jgi:hypothetical protein
MKIQLDTISKTIKVEGNILLGEFIDKIKTILPKKEWKTFILIPEIVINNWTNPIVIPWVSPVVPVYPSVPVSPTIPIYPYYPWITCETSETKYANGQISSGITIEYNSGIYNIDLQ